MNIDRILPSLALTLLLGACATSGPIQDSTDRSGYLNSAIQNASRMVNQGSAAEGADYYLRAAGSAPSTAIAADLRLRSASLYLDIDQTDSAAAILSGITRIPGKLGARYQLAQGRLLVAQQQYAAALSTLPSNEQLDNPAWLGRALVARASAQEGLGQPSDALGTRLSLDGLSSLSDSVRLSNHLAIWRIIQSQPASLRPTLSTSVTHVDLGGWLTLADTLDAAQGSTAKQDALARWRSQYGFHPAANSGFLDTLIEAPEFYSATEETTTTQFNSGAFDASRIALLLPTSGRMGRFAGAIEEGIRGASKIDPEGLGIPEIRTFDVGSSSAGLSAAIAQAGSEGYSMLLGPLQKEATTSMIHDPGRFLPAVALNDTGFPAADPNIIQFGLTPEGEAADAARFALEQGWTRALMLTPEGASGSRLARAFEAEFSNGGGSVLGASSFAPKAVDFSSTLRNLLKQRAALTRQSDLANQTGRDVRSEVGAPGDAQVIFMPASVQPARLLAAQLKYLNSRLPIIATSRINSGAPNARLDKDLDGIYLNDAPAILSTGGFDAQLINSIGLSAGQRPTEQRLRAFGADAYLVARNANELGYNRGQRLLGLTGILSMDGDMRIQRTMDWARLRNGQPILFRSAAER